MERTVCFAQSHQPCCGGGCPRRLTEPMPAPGGACGGAQRGPCPPPEEPPLAARPARPGGGNQHGHPHRATCAGRPPGPRAGRHTMGAAGPAIAGRYRSRGRTRPTRAAAPAQPRHRHSHSARRPLPRRGPCERALLAGLPDRPAAFLPARPPTRRALARRSRRNGASTRRKRIRMRWEEGQGKAGGRRERGTHRLHRRHLRALGSRPHRGAGRGRVKAPGRARLAARWSRAAGGRLGRGASREM